MCSRQMILVALCCAASGLNACGDDDAGGGASGAGDLSPVVDQGPPRGDSCVCDLGSAPADAGPPADGAALDADTLDGAAPDVAAALDAVAVTDAASDAGRVVDLGPEGLCSAGQACRNGHCVPEGGDDELCVFDADCRRRDPDAPTTCNAAAAGGICLGCTEDAHCPAGSECSDFGSCNRSCDRDADCPYGSCNEGLGVCMLQRCAEDADCPATTVCQDDDGDGSGLCGRRACQEVECSPANPDGTCPQADAACLYGACVAGCDPNPCDVEPHRTRCELEDGRPTCLCAAGYVADAQGVCQPEVVQRCPEGFECQADYCVDRAAPGFQCALDGDCAGLTCGAPITLPSGKCVGCATGDDCPNADACLAGYCLQTCAGPADCHAGMGCVNGYCGALACGQPQDCPAGYTCGGSGKCERRPCED